jgi:8-oxo-dGTP pyrophosphatase MutT (NUDIX family)
MDPGDELVDECDAEGRVVGVLTRAAMRAGNRWHRTVFVAVLTGGDEIVAHQRAAWKDVWPSHWDVAFGGVLAAGEDWVAGAVRELAEEAGVAVTVDDLVLLGEGRFDSDRVREHTRAYLVHHDGPFTFADGEVVAVERVPRAELPGWCAGHDLVPDADALMLPLLHREFTQKPGAPG